VPGLRAVHKSLVSLVSSLFRTRKSQIFRKEFFLFSHIVPIS